MTYLLHYNEVCVAPLFRLFVYCIEHFCMFPEKKNRTLRRSWNFKSKIKKFDESMIFLLSSDRLSVRTRLGTTKNENKNRSNI